MRGFVVFSALSLVQGGAFLVQPDKKKQNIDLAAVWPCLVQMGLRFS